MEVLNSQQFSKWWTNSFLDELFDIVLIEKEAVKEKRRMVILANIPLTVYFVLYMYMSTTSIQERRKLSTSLLEK